MQHFAFDLNSELVYVHLFISNSLPVNSAKITGSGGVFSSKPDPFVEICVDSQPSRKTDAQKKTTNPKWDDDFTL